MSTRKRLVLILIALLAVGLLWWSFRPQPVAVSVAEVFRGPLQVTVQQEGQTRVRDRYVISAPVAGKAARLNLEAGDPVQAGQVLLTLQPTPPMPLNARSRAQAEAQVNEAEAAYQLARTELDRSRKLAASGDLSRSALDQARAAAERARATLDAARAALAYSAGGHSDQTVETIALRSPVDGRVLAIEHKSEAVVAAGAPLLSVGDPGRLEAVMDALSSDAVQLHPGMRVLFQRWGGKTLEGRVRTIEPAAFTKVSALGVEEQRVWIIADFISPHEQWRTLGDGYRVEASFVLWEADDVLQLPSSSLFRVDDQWAAYVVEEGVARQRIVKTGQRGGLEVQVLEGLKVGEKVVTHPGDALRDGVEVAIRTE